MQFLKPIDFQWVPENEKFNCVDASKALDVINILDKYFIQVSNIHGTFLISKKSSWKTCNGKVLGSYL